MGDLKISEKKRSTAALLCFFLGFFGAHRFYTGKIVTAVVQALTLGGGGVWMFIDLIFILCGCFKDKNGNVVSAW